VEEEGDALDPDQSAGDTLRESSLSLSVYVE